ncbi:MAG: hypothetical protein ACOVQJ_08755 [Bacteroidia bacterium]|jgi:hypothetical protein
MSAFYLEIPKSRGEYPVLAVMCVLIFVGWAFHFGFFDWTGGFIYLGLILPLAAWFYFKRRGTYFVQVDENGISWRQSLITRYMYIPWGYMQRVDYLVYEINFMLKETAQVVSFATSGLTEEQAEALKQAISDALGEKPI